MYGILIFVSAVLGFVLLAWGIARVMGPVSKKGSQHSSDQRAARPKKSSRRWIVYAVIAIVLSFWSIIAALFFLGVVWVLLRNPIGETTSFAGKDEKRTARRVYTWLFASSLFTVPFFIYMVYVSYSGSGTDDEHVVSALVPLLFQLPLLLGLASGSTFVFRHTQQGILLIALRAGVAAIALSIGSYPEDGLGLFLLGNGALWLFGSIWGWTQVSRGECWWMNRRGESVIQSGNELEALEPEKLIERSRQLINRYDSKNAKAHALTAFRRGNLDVRLQAVKILDVLDEVEYF